MDNNQNIENNEILITMSLEDWNKLLEQIDGDIKETIEKQIKEQEKIANEIVSGFVDYIEQYNKELIEFRNTMTELLMTGTLQLAGDEENGTTNDC